MFNVAAKRKTKNNEEKPKKKWQEDMLHPEGLRTSKSEVSQPLASTTPSSRDKRERTRSRSRSRERERRGREDADTPPDKRDNPTVFLEVEIDAKVVGKMEFELFAQDCPRTAENFRLLCTGEKGRGRDTGSELFYEGCPFHRIVPGFMAQGGDFQRGDGTGGESIYGGEFADESFARRHSTSGLLSMANSGPNTNASQFFLLFAAAPHLDKKHVVFGKMVSGSGVLRDIEKVGRKDGEPSDPVIISRCGEVLKKSQKTSDSRKSSNHSYRDNNEYYDRNKSRHRSRSQSRERKSYSSHRSK
mmetsp:Transcript_13452/g.18411  ORF Transcript_13452/g.18411 Transcript_13452/m.18411 type:complete len:302 (+) Transcript_13452:322-1227(+)